MNATQNFLLRLVAAGIQIKASGNAGALKHDLVALAEEAKDSLLEPQDNGQPWDDAAILAWKAEHDALTAQIRDRHSDGAA